MWNRLVLSVFLLLAAVGFPWAESWKSYTDDERQKLAQSYWLAGTEYDTLGQKEKAADYQSFAKVIDPQLDPSSITDVPLPSAAELLAQGRTTTIGEGAAAVPTGSLNSFFLRFVGALSARDAAAAADFFDGSLYLSRIPKEVSRADAKSQLAAFFSRESPDAQTPSSLYDLSTAVIAPASAEMQTAWGETYTYSVTATADHSSEVGFWETNQQFYIHKAGPDWFILGEGPAAPPLTWSPRKAPTDSTQPPPAATEANARAAIADTFQAWMGAVLAKDADGAVAHMTETVRFLRVRQSVTRDELKTTLQGRFERTGFAGAALSDALDADSLFVQPVDSPVEDVTGAVYELNVRAKTDLSDALPFWSLYQRYYFAQEGSAWLIFAIL